jgi:hypothetical protein
LSGESNRVLVDVADLKTDDNSLVLQGDEELTRVPYIYCSHSRANLSDSCLTRDFGADPAERMKNIIDELNTWYIQRSFPRGRIGVSQFNYVSRYYSRIYDRMKSWHDLYGLFVELLARFFSPQQLETFLNDPVNGWGTKTWAVQNAFNYLVQTMLMPDVGVYGGPFPNADGTSMMIKNVLGANTTLGVDQARYFSTSWGDGDRDCGYEWYECLHHVGWYLDKVMAMEALSDSRTNFVARSSPEDLRQWEISYYTTFSEQIGQINSAMLSGDWTRIGPYVEFGRLKFPNYTGDLSEAHPAPVNPYATFTVQLYWQVLGLSRFFRNYDQSFRDESRIFLMGTGTAPDLGEDDRITYTDPTSGLTYGALLYADRPSGGASMLQRAHTLTAVSSYCDDEEKTAALTDDCQGRPNPTADLDLLDHIELIKVMADLWPMMRINNPYAP